MEPKKKMLSQLWETMEETEMHINTYRDRKMTKRRNRACKKNGWRGFWKNS